MSKVKEGGELRNRGWVVKDLVNDELDLLTNYPQSAGYARTCQLNEGFKWVEVEITYTEIEGSKL